MSQIILNEMPTVTAHLITTRDYIPVDPCWEDYVKVLGDTLCDELDAHLGRVRVTQRATREQFAREKRENGRLGQVININKISSQSAFEE